MASDASDHFLQVVAEAAHLDSLVEKQQMDNMLDKNLKALEVELDTVNAMINELLKRVSKEEERGLQTLPEVKKWISKVEEVEPKANSLLDQSILKTSTCSYSEEVRVTLQAVQTLTSEGVFEVVVDRAALPPLVKKMPPIQLTVSQEKLFQRTWNILKDENVGTLCLYGMGGIGKTTVLNQIKNKVVEAGDAFGLVMFVVVGSEEVELLEDKICERLGLSGLDKKTRKVKASVIHGVLNRKRFVLLFDDLQKKLNLNEIGIPLPSKRNGCKIVFTTRSRELCGVSDAEVEVECLSSDEACDLFQKTLGETTLQSHHDIPKLTRIIARNCRGLPLVLSVISKTMACKKMVGEWHHAIHVLVSSAAESILPILKLSYDSLPGENIRLCFLYCSLFSKISKQDLVDCWIGEGIIKAEDREIAEIKSYGMIGELVRMGLLMEDESGYVVKMHDAVREMALWIRRQKEHFFVIEGEGMVTRMSTIEHQSDSPDLKTLFLRGNRNISGDFLRSMTSLVLLDMSHNRQLSELPEEVCCLSSLQFLNLSCTSIRFLPNGLKELKRLIHLDLDHTDKLQETGVVASLLNLQVVRLFHSAPTDISFLVKGLQLLKSLKELSLTVEEDAVLQRFLSIHSLASCIRRLCLRGTSIANGGGILSLEAMFSLRELDIERCDIKNITVDSIGKGIKKIPRFSNIRRVSLSSCQGLKDLTWLLFAPRLGDLSLHECPQIEEIIREDKAIAQLGHTSEQPFQNLNRLSLCGLPELESIYWTPLPFPVLGYLQIKHCPKLRRVPFNSKSAIENQVEMKLEEEGVEWEDEATKQRFSHFSNRSLSDTDRIRPMYGTPWDSKPIQNIVLAGTKGSGKSPTAKRIAWKTVFNPLGHTSGVATHQAISLLIAETKMVKTLKSLPNELASAFDQLNSTMDTIDSLLNKQDLGVEVLKELNETIERARVLVGKCPDVQKAKYARKIDEINKDILKFCQTDLQFLQQKTLLQSTDAYKKHFEIVIEQVEVLDKKVDGLIVPAQPVFKDRCSVPTLHIVPVGLDWPLKELKKKLLNDSVNSLVVSASPGGGKTTLVTQFCHDKDIKRQFKNIFFTVVSSTPNFRVIVQDLLLHNGYKELTFENDHQAGIAFRNLLEKLKENSKKTLLVLDDVWNGAESLLQKFRITSPDFKILVTSRFEFQSFGPTYHLKSWEEGDAKSLLIHWASPPDHKSPAEYEELLQKILKRCDGIPILIEVLGVSLKGRSLNSWKAKVESWSKGETILDNPTVLERLQPSFNALKPQLKDCFLDMGSFLEDQKIRASVIIDIWVELYGKSSISCMDYLEDFASQNLLKIVHLGSNKHEDGFYNEFVVTQHDILRELAIFQTESEAILEKKRLNLEIREDTFPDWCSSPKLPIIINASLLSITTDDLFSSSWEEMDCPNVEALVLNISSSEYALPSFIAGMKKLKVLIITNHGSSSAKLTNLSCLSSVPNLKRIIFEKVSITLLDILQLHLGSLKKLSLFMCSISKVSYEKKETDFSKALSSLQEIDIDYCYDLIELPYWVSEAVSLKTLSVTNCNKISILPEDIGNLSKLEVLRLCSCINLSELPETTARLSNLQFLDISDCLGLKKLPLEIGKLQKLKKISMRKCSGCELPDSVKNLENLEVNCDKETAYLWESLKLKMRNLTIDEEETEYNLNMLHMF